MDLLSRYIAFCDRYLWPMLASVAILTFGAGAMGAQLRIDSDLGRLLPDSAPSVAGLQRLEEGYGGRIGRLTVVLEGPSLDPLEHAARDLAPKLERLQDVDRVEYERPTTFLWRYRLLFAEYEDLREVKRRIDRRVLWEKRRASPFFVDVSDEDPPAIELSDIIDKYGSQGTSDFYVNEAGTKLVMFVYPTFGANNLDRSRTLVDRLRPLLASHVRSAPDPIDFSLTGRYKKRLDLQELLRSDLAMATGLAIVALLIFLGVILRSGWGVGLVLTPLIVGTIWTFSWAWIAFSTLNLLTGFLGAILLGLGVDYGIHLYFRYHESRRQLPTRRALTETFRTAGRANLFAGLTTMVPLATLLISDFNAFFEFGTIAVVGVALILGAYGILFPLLLFALQRWNLEPEAPASSVAVERWCDSLEDRSRRHPDLMRWISRAAVALLAILFGVALFGMPKVEFNRDFYVLQSTDAPSWRLDEMVNEMLGRSQTPAVVLTDSPAHSDRVAETLRRRAVQSPGGSTIDEVVTLDTLIPEQQSEKLELLTELDESLEEVPDDALVGDLGEYSEELDRVLQRAPITRENLPKTLREPFSRTDEPEGSVVLVFPAVDLTDLENVEAFVEVLGDLPGVDHERGYDAVSEAQLLYDIVRYVERDAPRMLGLTLIGLFILSMLAFRRLRDSLLQFGVLGLAVATGVGWIGLRGVDFNFLNIVIIPIWLGLGVDATYHMLFDLRDHPDDMPTHITTGLAIAAAFTTSIIGFGATLVAHHEGLYSLGQIAIWELALMMIVNLTFYAFRVSRNRATTGSDRLERGPKTPPATGPPESPSHPTREPPESLSGDDEEERS